VEVGKGSDFAGVAADILVELFGTSFPADDVALARFLAVSQ